ncbi:MAG: hypothetical protein PHR14_01055 [Oscillospiraceae bacterium]|nr:hypothetical protein [Oscillospiraceae bacterium]
MTKKYIKYLGRMCVLLLAMCLCVLPVRASDMPFTPFTYNEWGEPVEGASGYEPVRIVDGATLGVGAWVSPIDIAVSTNGQWLYILDAEQGHVDFCNADFKNAGSLSDFYVDGKQSPLNDPRGLFASNDQLYIADRGNARVIRCDTQGNIQQQFLKPTNPLFPQDKEFVPIKVAADKNGQVYVLCEGIYLGMVMYSQTGEFLGFYGSNKVEVSLSLLLDRAIKEIVNEEAKDLMSKYTPVEYNNLCIDSEDFVYTSVISNDNTMMLQKLNAAGVNILQAKVKTSFQKGFGNLNPKYVNGVLNSTCFSDVAVDATGNIYGLDNTGNKIFVYDSDANLLFGFGGQGTHTGLFLYPTAIEVFGDKFLVLDNSLTNITVFEKTEFGRLVDTAMSYYNDGRYQEAMNPWQQVLKYNSNYTLAYIGIGKAQLESGDLENAMHNFEIAHYASGFNDSYREYRVESLRKLFPLFFVIVLLLLFLIYGRSIPPVKRAFDRLKLRLKKRLPGRKEGA